MLLAEGFADGCGCKIIGIGACLAVGFVIGLNIGYGFALEWIKSGCNGIEGVETSAVQRFNASQTKQPP